ncbi:MAG: dipeptidase [Paracoccaceae bacterium]
MTPQPIFDGHNDLLSCLLREGDPTGHSFRTGRPAGHIDLARARAGGLAGGFFAIWAPNDPAKAPDPIAAARHFPPIAAAGARAATFAQAEIFAALCAARPEAIRPCTSAAEIRRARADGVIAAVLHLEGAEAIGPDLQELHQLHALGLRSLGPVWSRPNIFGAGVPFVFPASPDTGPGLTEAGKRLVAECEALRIMVDLAHLNEAGFWDVAALAQRPLVSTHSAAHALCPASRNLTDRQLAAMAETGGLVGLNFGVAFLRPDGARTPGTAPEVMIRHLDHLIATLGEGGVALGSDLDGTTMPAFLRDAAGLPLLIGAMERAGYGAALIRRLAWDNWQDMLARQIG